MGSRGDTLDRGASRTTAVFARPRRGRSFDEHPCTYDSILVLSSVFRGKRFDILFYFSRSAQSTMGKAVDAFSKYFLCLKCKSCLGTATTSAFPPFPGGFGLTILQCFRFSRYAAPQAARLLGVSGVCGMDGSPTARPGAVQGTRGEVRVAHGLRFTRQ